MLEISHLTKIYKNKKGKDVHALNDVSLKFPETGMVFLLGKSGSGKSTLLNVCGGLDNPTSGEIIIKGKSSKSFTQSDFDSYRNTYVGFIFQEYNILEEFSVYDNIALAIELQNKKVNHDDIIKLLEDVDLAGYEKRKPNTLSGGQKQRIAIARALIKNPEIIMADEPTGALDSNTGKQVLDTLKKLSRDRLVIVVSHDRDFAETYADRIIELKDGKVISDNSKVKKESVSLSKNIDIVGDTLCINNGTKLDDDDFEKIKEFIKSDDKLILSKDKSGIVSFKKFAKISDSNEQEVFETTNENSLPLKEYDQNKNIFIKSKLPMKHAIKMGLSGLKTKPFRLVFTIFLCSISFLLFGLLSTMTFYNSENVFKDTLKKIDHDYIRLSKLYRIKEKNYYDDEMFEYDASISTSFYESDYNKLKEKYGKDTFYGVGLYTSFSGQKVKSEYYFNYFNYYSYMDSSNSLYKKITGSYPTKENEILLSSYLVDSIIYYNVCDSKNNLLNLKNREDIINKEIMLNNKKYKVVGFFDSGVVPSKYDVLKDGEENNLLSSDLFSYLNDSLHLNVFVSKAEIDKLAFNSEANSYYGVSILDFTSIVYKEKSNDSFPTYSNGAYNSIKDISELDYYGNDLDNSSVYVSPSAFADMVMSKYVEKITENSKYQNIYDKALELQNMGKYDGEEFVSFDKDEIIKRSKELFDLVNDDIFIDIQLYSQDNEVAYGDISQYKIVGIYFNFTGNGIVIFNDEVFNKLWDVQKDNLSYYSTSETKYKSEVTPYQIVYIPFVNDNKFINDMWNYYGNEEFNIDDSRITVSGSYVETLTLMNEVVDVLSAVFLYGGIFLCVFALLLLSNFISLSINNKTKEIGILRAVGARSIDVFKIFFSESFTITLICFVISIVLCVTVCDILNNMLASGIGVSVFVFGILSFVVIAVVCLVTTVVATYIPVRKAAKKKPVESIRSL